MNEIVDTVKPTRIPSPSGTGGIYAPVSKPAPAPSIKAPAKTSPVAPPVASSQLSSALGTDMPDLPGMMKQTTTAKTPQQVPVEPLMTGGMQAGKEAAEAQGRVDLADKERIAEASKKYAESAKSAVADFESQLKSHPEFAPSEETQTGLAAMFSLINVAAFMSGGNGRYSGMAALTNMANAMKGYREGKADLYNKEMKEYDKNIATLKANNDMVLGKMKRFMELMPLDKEAAMAELAKAKQYDQNGIISMKIRANDFKSALEYAEKVRDALQKQQQHASDLAQRAQQHREAEAARQRRHEELMKSREKVAEIRGARGSGPQQTAMNVMKQDVGNAAYNLDELKYSSEKTGKLPGGSVAFANSFKGDLTSDIIRYATTQTVDAGLQGNDALMLNLAFDIASAQSGGRGQLSDAKVRAVVSQMPLDDQPEETKRKKWGAIFQRFEEANKILPAENRYPEEKVKELQRYFQPARTESPVSGKYPIPTAEDIKYAKENPEYIKNFEKHFGRKP